jgi:hypothetical protein
MEEEILTTLGKQKKTSSKKVSPFNASDMKNATEMREIKKSKKIIEQKIEGTDEKIELQSLENQGEMKNEVKQDLEMKVENFEENEEEKNCEDILYEKEKKLLESPELNANGESRIANADENQEQQKEEKFQNHKLAEVKGKNKDGKKLEFGSKKKRVRNFDIEIWSGDYNYRINANIPSMKYMLKNNMFEVTFLNSLFTFRS